MGENMIQTKSTENIQPRRPKPTRGAAKLGQPKSRAKSAEKKKKKNVKFVGLTCLLLLNLALVAVCFALVLTRPQNDVSIDGSGYEEVKIQSCNCAGQTDFSSTVSDLRQEVAQTKIVTMEVTGWRTVSNKYWYKFFDEKVDYDNARKHCESMKAQLASAGLRNATVKAEIQTFTRTTGSFWIGLHNPRAGGDWVWADDVFADDTTDWIKGEPSHHGTDKELCARMRLNGKYNNIPCSFTSEYLCEKYV